MKQKDIALIIIVAAISGMLSFGVSQLLFGGSSGKQSVAVVDKVTTDFATPDPKFFNAQSINPSMSIEVGSGDNTNPFSGSGH